MLWRSFVIFFTFRPSDLITVDLRSYGQLLSLFYFIVLLRGKRKGELCSKNRNQKSYLPVSSLKIIVKMFLIYIILLLRLDYYIFNYI